MDWQKATPLLEQKLDTANVKAASTDFNGPKGDYLEGWHVINEANRIFGFDGWSYEILSLKQACEVTQNAKRKIICNRFLTKKRLNLSSHHFRRLQNEPGCNNWSQSGPYSI
jgi:recombination DNA repair RAD52 pathway protein